MVSWIKILGKELKIWKFFNASFYEGSKITVHMIDAQFWARKKVEKPPINNLSTTRYEHKSMVISSIGIGWTVTSIWCLCICISSFDLFIFLQLQECHQKFPYCMKILPRQFILAQFYPKIQQDNQVLKKLQTIFI